MEYQSLFEIKQLQNAVVRSICNEMKENHVTIIPSLIQTEIIGYLIKNEKQDIYQKDLENIFHLRRSTISGILKTLEKRGMIIRMHSKEDVRVKKIILTKEAKNQYKKVNQYLEKLEEKIISNISKGDLNIFYQVIEKMKQNIEMKEIE